MILTSAEVSRFSMTVESLILQLWWIQTGKDESTCHSPRVEQSSFNCDGYCIEQVSITLQQLWTQSRIDQHSDITTFPNDLYWRMCRSLTSTSTYNTQQCSPGEMQRDRRSTLCLLLNTLYSVLLSSTPSSSPPRPSNSGVAFAELTKNY